MDKFITTDNGGIPIVLDDHRHSDNSIRDFLNKILDDFSITIADNDNFIISGCAVTTGITYDIAAGYVWINGEVIEVEAQSKALPLPGNEYRLTVTTSYDSSGDKTTRAGTSIQTYQQKRGIASVYATGDPYPATQLRLSGDKLYDKIARQVNQTDSFKSIDIGDWDMDATAIVTIAHGLSDITKIRNIDVLVRRDDDAFVYSITNFYDATLPGVGAYVASIDATNVNITRVAGSIFDSTNFNATSFNRGYIKIISDL